MRLLNFYSGDDLRLGVVTKGGVLDVAKAVATLGAGPGAPVTETMSLLRGGSTAQADLDRYVQWAAPRAELLREENLRFAPAVPAPGKLFCIGLNYRTHAEESRLPLPPAPLLFSKFASALAAHGDDIPYPEGTAKVDYEVELVIVMGKRAVNVSEADALSYVAGYCTGNDVSARDLQFRTSQWLLGKSLPRFAPLGPYLVTADEVGNPQQLQLRTWIDDNPRQDWNTNDMIFSCAEIISYTSRYIPLEPGDVIMTGTPQGVADGYPDPKPWVQRGQTMTVEVEKLGRLVNKVV